MNLDNINEPTLIVAKSACIADIVLTFFVFLLGHCKFSVEESMNQTMVNVFAKDIVSILNNFNISLPNRENTPERQQAKDINEYKHDYTYYKNIFTSCAYSMVLLFNWNIYNFNICHEF